MPVVLARGSIVKGLDLLSVQVQVQVRVQVQVQVLCLLAFGFLAATLVPSRATAGAAEMSPETV